MRFLGRLVAVALGLALLGVGVLWVVGRGTFGEPVGPGEIQGPRVPAGEMRSRAASQLEAAEAIGVPAPKQILFGDLHVHSTYSLDAFLMSLPLMGGHGAHPVADACDFARYCSGLDFWSINDHAISLTPARWQGTIESLRECQAVAGGGEPDLVSFLGWEWTQIGSNPENHYGHKNVVLRDLDNGAIPARPIFAKPPPDAPDRNLANLAGPVSLGALAVAAGDSGGHSLARFMSELLDDPLCPEGVPVRDLPDTCKEGAETPADLFAKLDDWGQPAMVIPHGTAWGLYTPQGASWQKQASSAQHDPRWQRLVEVYSGHGNSEEFRDWTSVEFGTEGTRICPEPSKGYLPSCWRAGQIIRERCLSAGEAEPECERRAVVARRNYVEADISGFLTVPGVRYEDWLDSGQCNDCFQPAFNTRPQSSVQYMMALGGFEQGREEPVRLRFGFIASSDVHSARPGTGYKEYDRAEMTEARLGSTIDTSLGGRDTRPPAPESIAFDPTESDIPFFARNEVERAASFFVSGGLVAVHSEGRGRDAVWDALDRREVYGTSGPRILLWFDLLNGPDGSSEPMGSEVELGEAPVFEVRAIGSFEQEAGCSNEAVDALGPERIEWLCGGECLRPSDERRLISRIEVVRIRPQREAGERVGPLIEDPWRVFPCRPDPEGCRVLFGDPGFAEGARDAVYYVRAIEEPSPAVNAGNLRCERDEDDTCLEVHPCPPEPFEDDCLTETEHRAWSSPVFVGYAGAS